MTKELYIAGQRVVLNDSEVIAPSYQAFDVADITKIKFDFSNTFTLPYCRVNDEIFENAFRVQSQSNKRYSANECKLLIGGRELIANGVAELIGTDDKGYKVVVYSFPLEFFNEIAGLNIRDLDYTGYNHLNSIATVIASQARTDKYIYPLIDWHSDSPNQFIRSDIREIDVRYMMPCLFYHELLNKIFTEAGYVLNNNTELHPMFQAYDLTLTTDNKNNYLLYAECESNVNVPNTNRFFDLVGSDYIESWALVLGNYLNKGEDRFIISKKENFNITSTDFNWSNDMTLTGISPIATDNYRFRYFVNLGFGLNPNPASSTIAFAVLADNGTGNLTEIYRETKTPTSSNPQIMAWDFFINLNEGTQYYLQLTQITPVLNNPFLQFNLQRILIDKVNVDTRAYVPDIQQKDLIKNYLQLTGSFITFDNYTKQFTIDRFDKVIENKVNAKDWTEKKWNNNVLPKIDYKVGNYGISNWFRYAEDENDFKPINADGQIISTNQNLNKEYEAVELLFAASITAVTLGNLQIAKINAFEAKTGEVTIGNDTFQIPLDSKIKGEIVPRVLLVRRETLDATNPIGFTNGVNTVTENDVAIAHFIDVTQQYSLGFGSNILDTFYQWLQSILNDTIVMEDEYKLTGEDVAANELDFLTPVYMQQHNNYFYINKISNFVDNKKTKVQLIKI